MENTNADQSLFDIGFDENVKQQLKGAAAWGGLAAIAYLVNSILGIVNYFVLRQKVSSYGFNTYRENQLAQASGTSGLVSAVISLLIGIILFYLLNKFSRSTRTGLTTNDNYFINEGLGSLSAYFKFVGVLLIIILVFVLLAFLIVVVVAGSKM